MLEVRAMRMSRKIALCVTAAMGVISASQSMAAVSLALSANPSAHTGNSATVNLAQGQSQFTVGVHLISTSTATSDVDVDGVSYRFQQLTGPQVGSVFTLLTRDLTTNVPAGSQFSDVTKTDSVALDNSAANGFPATLSPSNTYDLGGSTAAQTGVPGNNYPGGTGTTFNPNLIGTYTIGVAPGTPNGTYTIGLLYFGPNSDYSYYTPSTDSFGFGTFSATPTNPSNISQTFTVVVTPEPSSAVLLGLGTAALALRRRRRALSFGL
jgi:hypothetical protein